MSALDVAALTAAAALIVVTGLLASAETVITRLPLVRALRLADQDDPPRGAEALVHVLERPSTSLNVVLVSTLTVRTLTAALVAVPVARAWPAIGVAAALAALVLVGLVVGEIIPRTLTLRDLERTGLRVARPLGSLTTIVGPLAELVVRIGRVLSNGTRGLSGPFASDEEIEGSLDVEQVDDELEDDERAMIESIFELGDTVTREIMTPRPDMVTVDDTDDLATVIDVAVTSGLSRLPVHDTQRNELAGILYAKDLLEHVARRPASDDWARLVRPTTFVPETRRVDDLLRDLREEQVHQALVVDEFGAVVGLVTIEDIVEEIVGEIVDEHDHPEPLFEITPDGMRVDARLALDDLNDLLGKRLPAEGWDTVGGLLMGALGRLPEEGERLELDGLVFTAERVQGRRIQKVHVLIEDNANHDDEDGS